MSAQPHKAVLSSKLIPLGRWITQAACKDADPNLFVVPEPTTAPRQVLRDQQLAASYCGVCPVRAQCLQDAREHGSVGVWGGILRSGESGQQYDLVARYEAGATKPALPRGFHHAA